MPRSITGYRDLSQEEIDLINNAKAHADTTGAFIEKLMENPLVDKRWLAIARTDLQHGFMALTRSIAKPMSF